MNIASINYSHLVRRLALGVEFEDILRGDELVHPVRVEVEYQSPHLTPRPQRKYDFKQLATQAPYGLLRHGSGRYSLSYYPGIREEVDLRIYDYERVYMPRRLRVPLLTLAAALAIEEDEVDDYLLGRVRNVVMFPGVAYHTHPQVTGLRGRVVREGEPMRWVFVEARTLATNILVARTRGDDRGEFLLILPPHAAPASELSASLEIRVSIVGPAVVPTPASPGLPDLDEYWDLPLEELPPAGAVDNVANGESFPPGYVTALSAVRTINFQVGRLLTGREVVDFEFSLP